MELICQGVWGSHPRPVSPEFVKVLAERSRDLEATADGHDEAHPCRPVTYGGDTTCLEVRFGDAERVILDAGTGFRKLRAQARGESLHVLLTHLHVDHVAGLTLCPSVWQREVRLVLHTVRQPQSSLWDLINSLYRPPLWPVQLRGVMDRRDCHEFDINHDAVELDGLPGSVRVRALPIQHTDPTVAYRIDADGASLVFAPDHECDSDFERLGRFAAGATLLVHDAQYLPEELRDKRGWGHSSYEQAIAVAVQAGVKMLLLWHHDPSRSDTELDELGRRAQEFAQGQGASHLRVIVAYDGLHFRV